MATLSKMAGLLILLQVWSAATADSGVDLEQPALAYIREHASPFEVVDPRYPGREFAPLLASIGGARIVGLGESSHGSGAEFSLKTRLIQELISHHGFDAVAIEINFTGSLQLNRYVEHGEGDPVKLLRSSGLYPIWQTEELLTLITWMRAFNQAGLGRTLSFIGFDMQDPGAAAVHALEFIGKHDARLAQRLSGELAPVMPATGRKDHILTTMQNLSVEKREALKAGAEALIAAFDAIANKEAPASNRSEWSIARHSAVIVLQGVEAFWPLAQVPGNEQWKQQMQMQERRDEKMAENVAWITREFRPEARIAVWAHNAHIGRRGFQPPTRSMGHFIGQAFGGDYVPILFAFHSGHITAIPFTEQGTMEKDFKVLAAQMPEDSVGALLNKVGPERFVMDFRALPTRGPVAQWRSDQPYRRATIGFAYSPKGVLYEPTWPLGDDGDIWIFNRSMTPARLLPFVLKP